MIRKNVSRFAAIITVSVGLAGCGAIQKGDLLNSGFWASSPMRGDPISADLGIAELTKGNYPMAEARFNAALKRNPKDPYALLGMAMLYKNTGRMTQARAAFEALLASRPSESVRMVLLNQADPKSVSEIASVNLALMESGGVTNQMSDPNATSLSPTAGAPMVSRMPTVRAMPSNPVVSSPMGNRAAMQPVVTSLTGRDANFVSRFEAIRTLLDEGLITPDEYKVRRARNIGALLPLTSKPAASGLERPLPPAEQIAARLRAISRALEMRAITISQHSAERSMILDGLMPAEPAVLANPGVPPKGLMAAADSVRRLEALKTSGLISSDEYTKERAAIESGLQPNVPKMKMAKEAPKEMSKPKGPQPGVHIGSYKSKAAANKGWTQLRRAHRALLGKLQPSVSKVNLGPRKGVFYRLKAGPLESQAETTALCRKLKTRRQFCDPSFYDG
ncbi:MAG: tetratricopeptide repeat protein [Rhodospirillales bacterium]|nr:tetratricopeptide repeat protein [Rhodospirillales bacterium]